MNRRVKYLGIFGAILQIGIVAQFFWRLIRSQWMFLNFQEWTEDSFSLVLLSVWDYAAICCSLLGVIFMFRALAKSLSVNNDTLAKHGECTCDLQ